MADGMTQWDLEAVRRAAAVVTSGLAAWEGGGPDGLIDQLINELPLPDLQVLASSLVGFVAVFVIEQAAVKGVEPLDLWQGFLARSEQRWARTVE